MIRCAGMAMLCLFASQGTFAQQSLSLKRPDPGIGEGFASAMENKFKTAFGVNGDEAKCLVYEVVTWAGKVKAYDLTPVEIAPKVASHCGLQLKSPRG
jgi:hypothetical protein